ncbi:MAG: hypothetical protein LBL83_08395, partial [Clostridiales bacterium]|nr:hypothetical protein [Clostridiales bacterium]
GDARPYLDDCAAIAKAQWERRAGLDDDSVPSLGPWYGMAEHSAFLGGTVEYAEDTSWHHFEMDSPARLDLLRMDAENPVFKMVVGGIEYARERYGRLFAPKARGTSGVLEIANTLRGSDFFYDLYDSEDDTRALLDYLEKAIVWYYGCQLAAAGSFMGGTVTGFGEWLPGRAIGQLSEDTTAMISPAQFEAFGLPHTMAIAAQHDGALMHAHALSEPCLPAIAGIPGITLMELSSDPNTDRAVTVFRRARESFKPIPVLALTRQELEANMDLLKTQKTVIWYNAASLAEAEDVCRHIRRELPVR